MILFVGFRSYWRIVAVAGECSASSLGCSLPDGRGGKSGGWTSRTREGLSSDCEGGVTKSVEDAFLKPTAVGEALPSSSDDGLVSVSSGCIEGSFAFV